MTYCFLIYVFVRYGYSMRDLFCRFMRLYIPFIVLGCRNSRPTLVFGRVARLNGPNTKDFLRPLHLIIRRYPAYHMTTRPQWHASSEKNRIPGLHRPPGHSKSRSSEHMESMCREEH